MGRRLYITLHERPATSTIPEIAVVYTTIDLSGRGGAVYAACHRIEPRGPDDQHPTTPKGASLAVPARTIILLKNQQVAMFLNTAELYTHRS
ncbi:hypothetical protein ANCCAN_06219 [Ancylostoma caninum]|uniref:Uncharacterized protein n=1 Tax=Ancylostoma caninum TaxID=29170 RepID=A0A368GXK7_ANCCA|nr:hypothetical protein ANCCAN_06219 [Ancylostoma caninum]